MREKTCITPVCQGTKLIKIDIESSLSIEKYECPNCGRPYICPTRLASASQVASAGSAIAIAGGFFMHALTSDWESAIEHAAHNIDRLRG